MTEQSLLQVIRRFFADEWRRDGRGRLLTTDRTLAEYTGETPERIAVLLLTLQEQGHILVDTWEITAEIRERHITVKEASV